MKVLSKPEFAERAASVLASTNPTFRAIERLEFGVVLADQEGRRHSIFFDRAYERYVRAPGTLEQILAELAAPLVVSLPTDPSRFSEIQDFVFPSLKGSSYREVLQQQMDQARVPENARPLLDTIGSSVAVVYVIDHPKNPERTLITSADLQRWNISVERLRQEAHRNLGAKGKIRISKSTHAVLGAFMVLEPIDAFAATKLVLEPVRLALVQEAGEDVVAAIPSQDMLMAMGRSNTKGVEWMRKDLMTQKFRTSPVPITDRLFLIRRERGALEELPV